jgi:hypothetical protein
MTRLPPTATFTTLSLAAFACYPSNSGHSLLATPARLIQNIPREALT